MRRCLADFRHAGSTSSAYRRPARWLRPGEVIETYDVWARKVMCPDGEGTIDQYLNVMPNWVGTKIGEGSAAARVLRVLYLT